MTFRQAAQAPSTRRTKLKQCNSAGRPVARQLSIGKNPQGTRFESIARAPKPFAATLPTVDESARTFTSRETLIVDALSAVFHMLDKAASAPRSRELRARARFYDRAIKHWTAVPPTVAQVDAMFDLVIELHARALSGKRTRSSA